MNAMHLTPTRAALAALPIVLITITPFLPFATTPTRWFGAPAVLVWMALMVLLTLAVLQIIDVGVNRESDDEAETLSADGEA